MATTTSINTTTRTKTTSTTTTTSSSSRRRTSPSPPPPSWLRTSPSPSPPPSPSPISHLTSQQSHPKKKNFEKLRFESFETEMAERAKIDEELRTQHAIPTSVDEPIGDLFEKIKENQFVQWTNFTKLQVLNIYQSIQSYFLRFRKRGPVPSSWNLDAFLVLLKSGDEYLKLGHILDVNPSTLEESIQRTRPVILAALKEKWWESRRRPTPIKDSNFPFLGLIVDVNSSPVYHPKTQFHEARHYFDGKNKYYSLKKEVAVMAHVPHYALFSQKARVGSTHDFTILKESFVSYLPYLLKTTEERTQIPSDRNESSWAILGDKAYEGNNSLQDFEK